MRAPRRIGAVAIVLASFAVACGGDDGAAPPTLPIATDPTVPATTAAPEPDATTTTAAETTLPPETAPPETAPPETTDTTAPAAPSDGVEFESPDGLVRVVFPAEPQLSELPVELPDGEVLTSPLYIVDTPAAAYFLSWTDIGVPADDAASLALLEDARDGAIGNLGGEIVTSEAIDVDGRVGLDFSGTAPFTGGQEALYQSIATYGDGRLYQVVAVTVAGATEEATGRAFLDSFEFTGAPS